MHEPQQERAFSQNGTVHEIGTLATDHRIVVTQPEKITMHGVHARVSLSFAEVELAPLRCRGVVPREGCWRPDRGSRGMLHSSERTDPEHRDHDVFSAMRNAALVQISPLHSRDQLLRTSAVVAVVGLAFSDQCNSGRMVEIVVQTASQPYPPVEGERTGRASCGSFSATMKTRFPLSRPASRTHWVISAMRCCEDASNILCVASKRRPSKWNFSIQ